MPVRYSILLSPVYLVVLATLLINDFLLKDISPGFISGKLSDFSGLFLLAVFASVVLNSQRKILFIVIALLFIFWKSEISEPLIQLWNSEVTFLPVARLVDYGDLAALIILYPAMTFIRRSHCELLKISSVFSLVISAFAIMATSYRQEEKLSETIVMDHPKEKLNEYFSGNSQLSAGRSKFTGQAFDTMEFFVHDTLVCSSGFYLKFIAEKINSGQTALHFLSAVYQCKKEVHYNSRIRSAIQTIFRCREN